MKFSTEFIRKINMRIGGLWGNKIETQIILNSEVDNPKESTVTIDSENVKCKFIVPNDEQVYGKEIRNRLESLSYYIREDDIYTYREVINALYKAILGDKVNSDELLCAVLDNEYNVDEYVYDKTDYEQEEN